MVLGMGVSVKVGRYPQYGEVILVLNTGFLKLKGRAPAAEHQEHSLRSPYTCTGHNFWYSLMKSRNTPSITL